MTTQSRAGRYVAVYKGQPSEYKAFHPEDLPPSKPPLAVGGLLLSLSAADQALGRLDGIVSQVPNPDLFVGMYVRQEAVLSSQIEGTQASLVDVLQFEAGGGEPEKAGGDRKLLDVGEVVNYVHAMNYGLERLESLPLSLRLIKEIHNLLMDGVRGKEKSPGEFRTSQNWVGGSGSSLATATYVPPPPLELPRLLGSFELFLHDRRLPNLIHAALAHAQFETIHPFLDGNGRVGRLLITFLLCEQRVLSKPLLYLSVFLKRHRAQYYDRLQAIRTEGAWEEWIDFFLRGVREVATDAYKTAERIIALQKDLRAVLHNEKGAATALATLDVLFGQPIVTAPGLARLLEMSDMTSGKVLNRLEELKIVTEITGMRRNRQWMFKPFMDLFERGGPSAIASE